MRVPTSIAPEATRAPPQAEHDDERHLDGQPGGVAGQRLPFGGAHPRLPGLGGGLVHALGFALFGPGGLDRAHGSQDALQGGSHGPDRFLGAGGGPGDPRHDHAGGKAEEAPDDQGETVRPCIGEQDPPGRRLGRLRLIVP
jgi:hypothetical protein